MNFPVVYEKCPCAFGTYRGETREWLNNLNLSDAAKLKIVKSWQKVIPRLDAKEKINECEICKGPSRGRICKACEILEVVNR